MNIYDKLKKCVTFNDIIMLSEDLYANGLSVQRTNSNKLVLCLVNADGKMSCNKLFEDFVPLTVVNSENSLIPNRTLTNIMEFVKNSKSHNLIKVDNNMIDVNALYGGSINKIVITKDMEKSIIKELKDALTGIDEVDAISRGCDADI